MRVTILGVFFDTHIFSNREKKFTLSSPTKTDMVNIFYWWHISPPRKWKRGFLVLSSTIIIASATTLLLYASLTGTATGVFGEHVRTHPIFYQVMIWFLNIATGTYLIGYLINI